ncbi:MAG: FAD-dependent monooxygenase [Proteobacteria bacterium]|nr:FAD-dependent monooxygenase [Pseudomonadota bacterium]
MRFAADRTFDVAVVGAGTAGAAAAGFCAEQGMQVVCIERARLDCAGARWVNGVPAQAFERAGLPRPGGDELRGGQSDFHLVAGRGPERLLIRNHGVVEVDMRLLVARLQRRARQHGALLVGETAVRSRDGGLLHTDQGTVRARWIVDASGLSGPRLMPRPPVAARHLCSAAQRVYRIVDRRAAHGFLARHGADLGETLCFTGIAGGFSILSMRAEDGQLSILSGSVTAAGHPSGNALASAFVARHSWIGEPLFGGARAIPLRRPADRLTDGRVALLGDAACQVFPAHGSGIATGLVAARILADELASGRGLHGYAATWQRECGGTLAASDAFRRFSQSLTVREVAALIASGALDAEIARAGLAQTFPRPPLHSLLGKAIALRSEIGLAGRLAAALARMIATRALYARYPKRPDQLPSWSRAVARLFAETPDVE